MASPRVLRVLYAVILVATTGFCVEIAARLIIPEPAEPVVPAEIGQFDAMLGWSNRPLATATSTRTGYEVEYRINSKGLRDEPAPYEKPEGEYRIVLLGDSRTFGFGVPIEQHFSRLLEGYFVGVDVINLGVNGFGVDQELLYLREEGVKYEPDVVMAYVAHFGNHRHMHSRRFGKEKPQFMLREGELTLTNQPVPTPPTGKAGPHWRLHRWMRAHSSAYEALRDGVIQLLEAPSRAEGPIEPESEDEANEGDPEFRQALHELAERLVTEMHLEALRHGAEFVLVTHVAELHRAAVTRGIASIDVSEPLANLYFPLPEDFLHINEAGNGVLAWEIASFLGANGLIPEEHVR